MVSKLIVFGMVVVLQVSILVMTFEYYIPLSAKAEMSTYCRNTLIQMECNGGLSQAIMLQLQERLTERGFANVSIDGTDWASQGELMSLSVEVDYPWSKLTGLFSRQNILQKMTYKRTAVSRRFFN